MSLSIPFLFGWLLNKKAGRVEVNISLAFLHWVWITVHPWPFVSDVALFVLKRDVKLQPTIETSVLLHWVTSVNRDWVVFIDGVQSPFAQLSGADSRSDARLNAAEFARRRSWTVSVARGSAVHVWNSRRSHCSEPVSTSGEMEDSM